MESNIITDRNELIRHLLIKRYCSRMRLIRARRKLTQKCIMQKFLQYQQASYRLFQSYASTILELNPPADEYFDIASFSPSTSKRTKRHRSNVLKKSQYWWKNKFPKLNDDEFYKIFHVKRDFFNKLCNLLNDKIAPLPLNQHQQSICEATSVEKQIALSLFKLSHNSSYKKTGDMFGLHRTTIHKCFHKFLRELIKLYDLDKLTANECHKMNENLLKKNLIHIPNGIGVLVRITFTSGPHRAPFDTLAIVDTEGKFHFVQITENLKNDSFYIKLDALCKKNHPDNAFDSSQRYLIITDQILPDIDCILNKKEIQNIPENYQLHKDIDTILKYEEDAVRKIAERWNILTQNLEFNSDFIPLIIKSCIILHNLYEDYLIKSGIEHQPIEPVDENQLNKDIQENIDKYEHDEEENSSDESNFGNDNDTEQEVHEDNKTNEHHDIIEPIEMDDEVIEEFLIDDDEEEENINYEEAPICDRNEEAVYNIFVKTEPISE